MKNNRIILFSIVALVIISGFFVYFKFYFKNETSNFKVDAILLKSVIKQGEVVSNNLKINNLKHEQNFEIYVEGLKDLVFLSEDNFRLKRDETKEIKITFNDKSLKEPGVYAGLLVIKTDLTKKEIPIILEIQSKELLFATNLDVSPEYKKVEPGEKFSMGIRIFNLKDKKTRTIGITYIIKNFNSETILSETENIVVGSETLITKTIILPKNIALKNYALGVIAEYDNSVSTSSYLFNIGKKSSTTVLNANHFAIIILIFLFAIIILVFYMIHERDKLFIELKKQHTEEIKSVFENVNIQKKIELSKVKKPKDKKKVIKQFGRIKKEIIKKVKEKHKKQKLEFEKLKKHKKKNVLKRKLEQWKKQGYNVNELLKITKQKEKSIKDKIKEWKKQGFDTSILKK